MIRKASPISGRFAEELMKVLTAPGYPFTAAAESEIVRDVTEKRCYVGSDCDTELETVTREMLIQPSFVGQRIPRLFFPCGCEVRR